MTGGAVHVPGPGAASVTTFTETSGELYGNSQGSTLDVSGSVDFQGGNIGYNGINQSVTVDQTGGSGSFRIDGSGNPYLEGAFETGYSTGIQVANTNFDAYPGSSSVTSTNAPIEFDAASFPASYSGSSPLTFTAPGFKIDGNTTIPIADQLVQTGGTTDLAAGLSLTVGSPFSLQGGTLDGTGTISGSVTNTSGTVSGGAAPGTLTITGDYSQASGGTLSVPVSSTSLFSALAVSGNITLDGTLAMVPAAGYANSATRGDSFAVITYGGSRTGTFSTITSAPSLTGGLQFQASYPPGSVDAVVPSPLSTAVALSDPVAGASGVDYTADLTTTSAGGLLSGDGTISIAFPSGTGLPPCSDVSVADLTSGASGSPAACGVSGTTLTITVPFAVVGGDQLQVRLTNVSNATSVGAQDVAIATSANNAATASFTLIKGVPISGTASGANGAAAAGAIVSACPTTGGGCSSATTDTSGDYTILVASAGSYDLTASISVYEYGPQAATPLANVIVPAAGLSNQDLTFTSLAPLPTGASLNGQTGAVPHVYWYSPAPFSVQGSCDGGLADLLISSAGSSSPTVVPLSDEADPGVYSGAVPALYGLQAHGPASATLVGDCNPSDAPTTNLLPDTGSSAGGDPVIITGSGLSGATSVDFGSNPATSILPISDTTLIAVSPPGTGTVYVTVTTPAGTTTPTSADEFSYAQSASSMGSNLSARSQPRPRASKLPEIAASSGAQQRATSTAGSPIAEPNGAVEAWIRAQMPTYFADASAACANDESAPSDQSTANIVGKALYQGTLDVTKPSRIVSNMLATLTGTLVTSAGLVARVVSTSPIGIALVVTVSGGYLYYSYGEIQAQEQAALSTYTAYITALLTQYVNRGCGGNRNANPSCTGVDVFLLQKLDPCGVYYNFYIDPSGTVVDTNGNPISGATVTILRGDTALGPFLPADPTGPDIEPGVNPETTGSDGIFHWDVVPGEYEIEASAPGCHAPGNASQTTVTSAPLPVPPPQVGIVLTLQCANESPPPTPTVAGLDQTVGPTAGSTKVTVTGTGFTPSSTVRFGTSVAQSVTFLSPTVLQAVSPAGAGTVDVIVSNGASASATTSSDQFTYADVPTVTGISPSSGPLAGGTPVTIEGKSLPSAEGVTFGGQLATSFSVNADGSITATAPPGSAGPVDVQVVDAAGVSSTVAADQFTYEPNDTLTVALAGSGSGSVSDGASLDCPGTCTGSYLQGSTVTLAATAASGSTFDGWSGGGCSGTGQCVVTISAAEDVTATFDESGGAVPSSPGAGPGPGPGPGPSPKVPSAHAAVAGGACERDDGHAIGDLLKGFRLLHR